MGDFYKLTIPFHTIYVTTSPEVIQQAFVVKAENYRKSKIYWQQLKAITGDSIGTLEGKEWSELRTFENQFYKPTYVQEYLQSIVSIIEKHIRHWKEKVPVNKEYNISALLSQLNIEIILKTVFGLEGDENLAVLANAIADGENIIAWRSKFPWRPYSGWITGENYRTKKDLKVFDDFVEKNLPTASPDFLAKKLYYSLPDSFSEAAKLKRVRNELIVHLGAGTETAAVSLSWTLYLLTKHPEILEKVEREVGKVEESTDIFLTIKKLPYLKQVIEESLRLYPPSHAIVRDCKEEYYIKGHKISMGETLYASVYGLHRNPGLWDEPEKFNPDRFTEENKKHIPDYAYIPFGVGKHTCIGRYLAMPILMISLLKIIKNFKIENKGHELLMPLSLSTLKPDKEVKLNLSVL